MKSFGIASMLRQITSLTALAVLVGCSEGDAGSEAVVPGSPTVDSAETLPVSDTVHVSQLPCENLESNLLNAELSRSGLTRIHGAPDSVLGTTEANRHVEGAVDSLFTVFYPGFRARFRTPTGGRDLIESITITDNRYLSDPRLGIGAREADVIALLGTPTRRQGPYLIYDCGQEVEQPVRFELRDERVISISIIYYVD